MCCLVFCTNKVLHVLFSFSLFYWKSWTTIIDFITPILSWGDGGGGSFLSYDTLLSALTSHDVSHTGTYDERSPHIYLFFAYKTPVICRRTERMVPRACCPSPLSKTFSHFCGTAVVEIVLFSQSPPLEKKGRKKNTYTWCMYYGIRGICDG